jgi:hypothetical protein
MSFLNSNNSEYLSARITNRGRKAIANGSFNIQYFQIGDSEYDYNVPFNSLTGTTGQQKVFSPLDKDGGVKYPFGLDSTVSTTYGSPISNNLTTTLRNEMGPAGFVSKYSTTPTVQTTTQKVNYSAVSGSTSLVVPSGATFNECEYITLVFDNFSGTTITGKTNSLIYKVLSVSGNTLNLDRKVPNLTSLTGNAQVVCNKFSNETTSGNLIYPIDYTQQLNSWKLNTVWTDKPIGGDYNGTDESLSGYTSNQYASIKNLLGYTKTGQTFNNFTGGTITGTTYKNSFDELVEVSPSEQRCVAILHYSELGDILVDPERFFKYDDYISSLTGTTGTSISLFGDLNVSDRDYNKSDNGYFEVYIPFIYYHRNSVTGGTLGALFTMDTTDYYIKSSINSRHQIKFRYLVDERNNKVGKVFVDNKIIVFDDQELVAMLDYRSNRRYTLPSPKLGMVPSDGTSSNSLLPTTGDTVWLTYMFGNTSGDTLNALPCNYFNKITGNGTPSQLTFKFNTDAFPYISGTTSGTTLNDIKDIFVADKFYALVQTGSTLTTSGWKKIDITSQISGYTSGYINHLSLNNYTFTITKANYTGGTSFDLEDHMSGVTSDYLWNTTGSTTQPQFGDEQPFPGSVRLVRATDIEEMNMMINLPSTQFTKTQNPTYVSGDKYITEVALLNSNKEPLVVAKAPTPVKRAGTQVFAIKLDF